MHDLNNSVHRIFLTQKVILPQFKILSAQTHTHTQTHTHAQSARIHTLSHLYAHFYKKNLYVDIHIFGVHTSNFNHVY